MILDESAIDPSFSEGRVPDQVDQMVERIRTEMKVGPEREWTVVSARRKFGKELVEIEESGPDGVFRMIAKTGKAHRIRLNYEALHALWAIGFQPPERLTVPEPIAYFPERALLVQEKAPGVDLLEKIREDGDAEQASKSAAEWLAALHNCRVRYDPWEENDGFESKASELASISSPAESKQIGRIAQRVIATLRLTPPEMVPCHGDFHLLNIFLAPDRVTAIDLDKFGGRDRAEEVGYALCQMACICYHRLDNFNSSLNARRAFLAAYEPASGTTFDRRRLGAYMARTFLTNLHFELYACKTGRIELLAPWLDMADECLLGRVEIHDT